MLHSCPVHSLELLSKQTQYGTRYECTVSGCTVVCWDGKTSTPADAETRALRARCHKELDPLHRSKGRKFKTRTLAYVWLAEVLKLPSEKAHIGMLDKQQCEKLLQEIDRCRTT